MWFLFLDEIEGSVVHITHSHSFLHMLKDILIHRDKELVVVLLLLYRGEERREGRERGERGRGREGKEGGMGGSE